MPLFRFCNSCCEHQHHYHCRQSSLQAATVLIITISVTVQVWECKVDIAAVASTCSEWPLLLAFLQRRQPTLHPNCDIKAMLLTIVKVHEWVLQPSNSLEPLALLRSTAQHGAVAQDVINYLDCVVFCEQMIMLTVSCSCPCMLLGKGPRCYCGC